MKIRPIKNNRDYREALKEIDRLMDARPNTLEGDRLDVLVTLVEAWEEKHWPIDSPDPSRRFCLRWSIAVFPGATWSHLSGAGHEWQKYSITRGRLPFQ